MNVATVVVHSQLPFFSLAPIRFCWSAALATSRILRAVLGKGSKVGNGETDVEVVRSRCDSTFMRKGRFRIAARVLVGDHRLGMRCKLE